MQWLGDRNKGQGPGCKGEKLGFGTASSFTFSSAWARKT